MLRKKGSKQGPKKSTESADLKAQLAAMNRRLANMEEQLAAIRSDEDEQNERLQEWFQKHKTTSERLAALRKTTLKIAKDPKKWLQGLKRTGNFLRKPATLILLPVGFTAAAIITYAIEEEYQDNGFSEIVREEFHTQGSKHYDTEGNKLTGFVINGGSGLRTPYAEGVNQITDTNTALGYRDWGASPIPSLGSDENIDRLEGVKWPLSKAQLDNYRIRLLNGTADHIKVLSVEDDAPECVFILSIDEKVETLDDLLGQERPIKIGTYNEGSGSYFSTDHIFRGQHPEGDKVEIKNMTASLNFNWLCAKVKLMQFLSQSTPAAFGEVTASIFTWFTTKK